MRLKVFLGNCQKKTATSAFALTTTMASCATTFNNIGTVFPQPDCGSRCPRDPRRRIGTKVKRGVGPNQSQIGRPDKDNSGRLYGVHRRQKREPPKTGANTTEDEWSPITLGVLPGMPRAMQPNATDGIRHVAPCVISQFDYILIACRRIRYRWQGLAISHRHPPHHGFPLS